MIHFVFDTLQSRRLIPFFYIGIILLWIIIYAFFPDTNGLRKLRTYDYIEQVDLLHKTGNIIDENGEILDNYPPLAPLWIYFIEEVSNITGVSLRFMKAFWGGVLILISMVLSYKISRLLFSRSSSTIVTFLIGTYPHFIYGILMSLSTTLFIPFFLSSVYFLFRVLGFGNYQTKIHWEHPIFVGIFSGLAMLVRPTGMFLPILYSLLILFNKKSRFFKRIWTIILLIVACLITILPWEVIVYKYNKRIVPVSEMVGGEALRGSFKYNYGEYFTPIDLPEDLNDLNNRALNSIHSTEDYFKFILKELRQSPWTMSKYFAINSYRQWYGTDAQRWNIEIINIILAVFYLSLFIYALVLPSKNKKYSIMVIRTFIILILYFWVMAIPILSLVRYMVPSFLLMIIFSGKVFNHWEGQIMKNFRSIE
jgi:hypothetical protein